MCTFLRTLIQYILETYLFKYGYNLIRQKLGIGGGSSRRSSEDLLSVTTEPRQEQLKDSAKPVQNSKKSNQDSLPAMGKRKSSEIGNKKELSTTLENKKEEYEDSTSSSPNASPEQNVASTSKKSKKGNKARKIENKSPNSSEKTPSPNIRGRGIEGRNNSCYMDSTLFALFHYDKTFDSRLLFGEHAKDSRNEISDQVTQHLKEIVDKIRSGYCPFSYVETLRTSMLHINSRLRSDMMDVDEFISNLFGRALHLKPFLNYYVQPGVTTGNYFHQIIINTSKPRANVGSVASLLKESMAMQRLKFADYPDPALIIKMPRSNGKLVGHTAIVPNIQLDISEMMVEDEEDKKANKIFELRAVIVLRGLHYTVFVQNANDWEYFNDLPPSIRQAPDITKDLLELEKSIEEDNNDVKYSGDISHLIRDIHVCIYV